LFPRKNHQIWLHSGAPTCRGRRGVALQPRGCGRDINHQNHQPSMRAQGQERRRGRPPTRGLVCPRCGAVGYLESYSSGGRRYLRVRHGSGRSRSFCYIGPADSYEHVEVLHMLGLTNVKDVDYAFVVESAIRALMSKLRIERLERPEGALAAVRDAIQRLEHALEDLRALEKDIEKDVELRRKAEEEVWA